MEDEALEASIAKFREIEDWCFNSYANSSCPYLRSLLEESVVPAIEKAILVGFFWRERYSFLNTLIKFTFTTHTPVGVIVVLCILFACFLPCIFAIIVLYRRKQKRGNLSTLCVSGPKSLWASFVVFVLSSLSALACAIILGYAAGRGYYTLVVPFRFAAESVDSAFRLSGMLRPLFENYIREMSHNTFESSLSLYKVDEEVGKAYLDRVHRVFLPVFEIAGTLNYQMTQALEKLSHYHDVLPQTLNRTVVILGGLSGKYVEAVRKVAYDYPELDAIIPLPDFNVSSEAVGSLETPIGVFRNVSKINLQLGFRDMNNQLEDFAYQEYFDPTDLVSELRHFAFEVESRLRPVIDNYLAFVEKGFQSDKDSVIRQIRHLETEAMEGAFPIFFILMVASLTSMGFVVVVLTAYVIAFVSARVDGPVGKLQALSGRVVLYSSFANTCLMLVLWVLSLFLFLLAVVAMGACMSVGDRSIFDVTFDDKVFHEQPHWFDMFSSTEFNMTLKDTVSKCSDGTAYVPFIPGDLPSKDDAWKLVAGVNYTSVADSVRNRIQNLTGYDDSLHAAVPENMTTLLDDVNVRPPFLTLKSVLENVTNLDSERVLKRLARKVKNETIQKEIDVALKSYKDIVFNLADAIAVEKDFDGALKSVRNLVLTYEKGLEDMSKASMGLVSTVVRGSPIMYESILKKTVSKTVHHILFEMRLTVRNFRHEIAFCKYVLLFYDVVRSIFCNVLLFPVVTAWKMSVLLCFLLVLVVVTSVLPLHVFLGEGGSNNSEVTPRLPGTVSTDSVASDSNANANNNDLFPARSA